VLSSNVRINDGATIADSILFDGVTVGENCQLANCIIDKHVVIPDNTTIGIDLKEDAKRFHISSQGIVVVPEGYCF
jgi:glucose-1-phosphate adenylyltransferase